MARPGPTCHDTSPQNVNDGTSCRAEMQPADPLAICSGTHRDSKWDWGYLDAIRWKVLPPRLGGDRDLLRNYKDGWVKGHREAIKRLAAANQLPPELLAGVAWIEVGGKPYSLKLLIYEIRRFDHMGDPFLEPLTITKKAQFTSTGAVAIQLRRAAEALGLSFESLSKDESNRLVECLQSDDANLQIVAKYLAQLKQIDFPNQSTLGPYEIRIIGARYNRGSELSLQQIRRDTSYGDFIVGRIYSRLQKLLSDD